MKNQQLFEAPFISEVTKNYTSKSIKPEAGKCMCRRCQGKMLLRPKSNSESQWLFEAPPILETDQLTHSELEMDWETPQVVLQSQQLRGDPRLDAAANNNPPFRYGEKDGVNSSAVNKLQQALITLGYSMPITTKNGTRAPDGIYGDETFKTIQKFQSDQQLTVDGIAGKDTLHHLDRLLRLPRVTNVKFVNKGRTHPDNCCKRCPQNLGVGINGTGRNSMELQFTISGHRSGIWYDIIRTRRSSLWEKRAGVWNRLENEPMGTSDDTHNDDECLTIKHNRIFVIDRPGFRLPLPAPDGTTLLGLAGSITHVDATEIVLRLSFAEWVIAKHPGDGIPWTVISKPKYIFWHNITWLIRDASNQWVLDKARSEIELGSLSDAIINSQP